MAKVCKCCDKQKQTTEYYKNKQLAGGVENRCKQCETTRRKDRYQKNKNISLSENHNYSLARKQQLVTRYGGECACCGEYRLIFLSIDHINGDGAKHRRVIGKTKLYSWLINNNYPTGFQVLCMNCNWAKSHGGCPHKREEEN